MPGGSHYRWGRGFPTFLGVGGEETRRPAEGSSGLGHERRAAIFLMQFTLEITEKDFRRRPGVWNRSAKEGASRGAGRGRAGPGGADVAGNWIPVGSRGGSSRGGLGPSRAHRSEELAGPAPHAYRKPRGPPQGEGGGGGVLLTFDVGACHPILH